MDKNYVFEALPVSASSKQSLRNRLGIVGNTGSIAGAILGDAAVPKGLNIPPGHHPELLAVTSMASILEGALDDYVFDPENAGLQLSSHGQGTYAVATIREHREIIVELSTWASGPLKLERIQGSQMHAAFDAWSRPGDDPKRLVYIGIMRPVPHKHDTKESLDLTMQRAQVFLIEHDWSAALKAARDGDGGEWRMPFPCTVIELALSGKRVLCMFDDMERDGYVRDAFLFVRTLAGRWCFAMVYGMRPNGSWEISTDKLQPVAGLDRVMQLTSDQLRAMSIALDAEVVRTEVVRAPHKLNHAREKAKKPPIKEHHILNLARRERAARAETPAGEERTSPRLHFRRGHWRHFANSKTWIRWMLVGDPDLGSIDKEYRL